MTANDKHFDKLRRQARVKRFMDTVTLAAIEDAQNDIPAYHPSNTGDTLLRRLNLASLRVAPRNGDGKYARSVYTAAHWLYETEIDDSVKDSEGKETPCG